jgi:maltose O-acetyltransferase
MKRGTSRILDVLRSEIAPLHPRLLFATLLIRLLPQLAFQRLRTALYRGAGIAIGPHTLVAGTLQLVGPGSITSRLTIGANCYINAPIFFDLTAPIAIGDGVGVGHHAIFITGGHTTGPPTQRTGQPEPQPIVIHAGAWVGADVTLLPGAVVGAGSIIGAGSLVVGNIPANVLAVGRPAKVLRVLAASENAVDIDRIRTA